MTHYSQFNHLITTNPTLLNTPLDNLLQIASDIIGYNSRYIDTSFFNTCTTLAAQQQYQQLAEHILTLNDYFDPQYAEESMLALYTEYAYHSTIQYQINPITITTLIQEIQQQSQAHYLVIYNGTPQFIYYGYIPKSNIPHIHACTAAWRLDIKN